MRNYEVTFIVDPVLSGDEIKATAQTYIDQLEKEGCTLVHVDEMGLKTMAYPIKKRNSGVYYCVEFSAADGSMIDKIELALRRDERIMRFLTVALDKFGVKYNQDKRDGKIGKVVVKKKEKKEDDRRRDNRPAKKAAPAPKAVKEKAPAAVAEEKTPVVKEEAVAEAPVVTPEAPVKEAATPEAPAKETAAPEAPAKEETTDKGGEE